MSLLSIQNISSGYGNKEVIHNVSLELEKGEITALVGSNGAGKSTILKAIYGIIKIWNNGTVWFNGENISGISPEVLLQEGIVYIGQKNNTFDTLTVLENLVVAGFIYKKRETEDKIQHLVEMFPQFQDILSKMSIELSGGQQQLLALAMGLIHEPKLILFDEPSVGLDRRNMDIVFGIINRLAREKSISFLIVEHRVKEILQFSDKIIGLKLGKVFNRFETPVELELLSKVFL